MATTPDFETLVRTHQAAVCATAYSVLRDRARAEEVAQDAFLLAWQKLPAHVDAGTPPALPGWICGIARNLARNTARKKREVAVADDHDAVADDAGPLDSLLLAESRSIADRALATLDEHEREAIAIYYMGDGQHADVARALGISDASARQRVHRARTKLRDAAAAVETTLRAARPGPAFTASCVAALAAGKVAVADAATLAGTTAKSGAAVGTGVLLSAAAALVVASVAIALVVSSPAKDRDRATRSSSDTSAAPAGAPSQAIDRAAIMRRMSREKRAELVERLRAAGSAIVAAPAGTAASAVPASGAPQAAMPIYDFSEVPLEGGSRVEPPPPNTSPKRLVRYAIQEIQPLLLECHAGLPSHGTLAMRLILSGAPGVGTIIESVEIDPDGASAAAFEPSFTECMRETLYAIELPALANVDRLDVRYPFVVSAAP